MRVTSCGSRKVLKIIAAGFLASATAACGSDSSRFSENPFTNPFAATATAKADPATTASLPSRAAPIGSVTSRPLPPAVAGYPVRPAQDLPPAVAGYPVRPAQDLPPITSAPRPQASPVEGSAAGWTAAGGTPVMVGPGETASILSARYGVPVAAITAANGGQVKPGQQAIIPIFSSHGGGPKATLAAPSPAATLRPPAAIMPAQSAAATARPSQSLVAAAQPGKAAKASTNDDVKPKRIIAAAPKAGTGVSPAKPATAAVAAAKPLKAPEQVAAAQPRVIPLTAPKAEAPAVQADATTTASIPVQKPALATEEKAEFRWPARGRIISGFGSKGGNGDGIAIAVPEGTPVKAAADGVVAYAGEELKGYGKMVLVRHDNGYVTAYAHNGDLNVKRGEKVTRGQTIAKSGATGNVTSPQLHFELRKGSTPIDPTKYLDN
jgi:murein DD-endopeptidase MepM/ murein hydrolase activator NlpD